MSATEQPSAAAAGLPIGAKPKPRRFHQASWDEPLVFELSTPGRARRDGPGR